ncbi:MAG TPA: hypothetical protein PLT82_07775 [Candidatus Hydrogenedens sp.]|nr:hypothetical protein [Candidatus Hydrogenedens sp.]HOK09233.1 hypothetical protein [Candidatus Hydrogenedens sp.]HPP59014.1 hypothetical protein [Candidatus Hydrogenedens sp.]
MESSPSLFQIILWELQRFANQNDLRYLVPSSTILIIIGLVLLNRKWIISYVGATLSGVIRGVLMAMLCICAFLAVGNYIDSFGQWRYGTFFNAYEFYHYYMGSKYAKEIGYTRLYAASLIADDETDRKYSNSDNTIRNLANGMYISVDEVLKNRDQYKSRFSPERWEEWLKDIRFFKRELTTSRWNNVLRDKGYNATPVWSMLVGGFLSNPISTENRNHMLMLASLDLVLIGITTLIVLYAFGLRPAMFMLILIGTHYMMRFSHMKGAYLRTDFAMCLVLSACMIKLNHYKWAGFFTAYSVLSRVFPAVFLFGPGARLFWDLCKLLRVAYDELKIRFYDQKQRRIVLLSIFIVNFIISLIISLILRKFPSSLFESFTIPWPLPIFVHLIITIPLILFGMLLFWVGVWGYFFNRMERHWVHYFVTFIATLAILFISSFCYYGGLYQWRDYADKIGRHSKDISPWRVGYKYIFIAQYPKNLDLKQSLKDVAKIFGNALLGRPYMTGISEQPTNPPSANPSKPQPVTKPSNTENLDFASAMKKVISPWKTYTRSIIYKEQARRWWVTMAIVLILCLIASRRLSPYESFVFGFVPCFFLVSPTYYYYIMLAVPLLFFSPKSDYIPRAIAIIWLYITAMAGYFFYTMWEQEFPTYYWLGCMLFVLCIYMLIIAMLNSLPLEYLKPWLCMIKRYILDWFKTKKGNDNEPPILEEQKEGDVIS